MKVEDAIGNVGRGPEISMTGSRNIEANEENLRSLDVAGGTSAERAGRSTDVECRMRHSPERRESHRPFNASIPDRHIERLYWRYLDNGSESASEKLRNRRE
jgi:hypothetical protein